MSPTLVRRQVLWGHSQIPQITLALHPDCLLAWKQFCGCRWGFLRRETFKNVLFQSWVNVMIISFAWVIVSGLADCSGAGVQSRRTREDQAARLLFVGYIWKDWRSSERYHLSISFTPCVFNFNEQGEALRVWTKGSTAVSSFLLEHSVHCETYIRAWWRVGDFNISSLKLGGTSCRSFKYFKKKNLSKL